MQKLREMPRAKQVALLVVFLYALEFPAMAFMSYLFLQNTVLELEPNEGSLVGRTMDAGLHLFHNGQVYIRPFAMMIVNHNTSQPILNNSEFKVFADYTYDAVYGHPKDENDTNSGSLRPIIEAYINYYTIPSYISFVRDRLIGGTNNGTTLMQFEFRGSVDMNSAVKQMVRFVESYENANNPSFEIRTTSVSQVFDDLQDGIIFDLLKVDAVSVPISVLVLVLCVGSFRMVSIPAVLVPMTLVCTFGIMYPISHLLTISSLAPEMSAAVLLAITVDYSLFFATRFMDEASRMRILKGDGVPITDDDRYEVVLRTTTLTAHNVLVSGLTIAISLAGIAILPAYFIRTIGLVFALGACVAVVVAMTLVPALLMVFYDFFAAPPVITKENMNRLWSGFKSKCCCCCPSSPSAQKNDPASLSVSVLDNEQSAGSVAVLASPEFSGETGEKKSSSEKAHLLASPANHHVNRTSYNVEETKGAKSATENGEAALCPNKDHAAFVAKALKDQRSSFWFRAASLSVRFPYLTILVLFAVAAPFVYYATTMKTDFVIANQVPRNAKHVKILNDVQETIGQGTAFPFTAVLVGHGENSVLSDPFFNKTYEFMKRIEAACNQKLDDALTYTYLPGLGPIQYKDAAFFLNNSWFPGAEMYQYLFNLTVNEDRSAGIVKFTPGFNPFGTEAYRYLNSFEKVINAFTEENKEIFSFVGVVGSSALSWQIMVDVLAAVPIQVGVTFGVILILIACSFRSVFIPIRMLITVAYTVGIAYGAGAIAFQHEWMWKIWPAMEGVTAYSWTCPIFSFSLVCALALDYDIFLLTRVVEMKQLGFNDEAAIVKAVYKTGRIISFAGVIMAVAFGALMFASVVLLNQYAFVAFVAVLVDTFIVRTFLVPALMSILPSVVWWPRKFADATLGVDDIVL